MLQWIWQSVSPPAAGHPFATRENRRARDIFRPREAKTSLSTIAPKWSDPSTPPPKVVLPEGKSAPRLGGSQKPLSRGFLSNLRDFLMERPVKISKHVRGDVFTIEEYGGGIGENLKEWFKPTPKAVSSRMTVEWQSPYKVMWQNLARPDFTAEAAAAEGDQPAGQGKGYLVQGQSLRTVAGHRAGRAHRHHRVDLFAFAVFGGHQSDRKSCQ